jgi:hypothetical protein
MAQCFFLRFGLMVRKPHVDYFLNQARSAIKFGWQVQLVGVGGIFWFWR